MLRKNLRSYSYALKGIKLASRENNFRIQALMGVAAVLLGVFLRINPWEWVAIVLCIAMVLGMETLNTALEAWVDVLQPNHHPLAGKVKDLSAGAVLIVAIGAAVVGTIIFLPKILLLL